MAENIRVLVVDDQELVREGIASLLVIQPGIEVVGTAEDGQGAVDMIKDLEVDVILMDVMMPGMDGIEATAVIMEQKPDVKILMLTTLEDEEKIMKSLQAGACGYLLKDILAPDLAQTIRMVSRGIFQFSSSVAGKLVNLKQRGSRRLIERDFSGELAELRPRELDVLKLLATGANNREIAAELFLSEGTVKNIVSRIFQCLGVHDRVQAALIAIQHDVV